MNGMYELTYVSNLNDYEARNCLTWIAVWTAHAVTFGRWPNMHGWILWDTSNGGNIAVASNMQICADEASCADARAWAADEIRIYDGHTIAQWTDATNDHDGIVFIGEPAAAFQRNGDAS